MKVEWKNLDHPVQLAELVRNESNAEQRDRYRVVLLAGNGRDGKQLKRDELAAMVGRSRAFVDTWIGRYRNDGLDGLKPQKQKGAECKLTVDQQQQLTKMLDDGPPPDEQLAAYNGPILQEKIEQMFGKTYSLSGVYQLLHRLGYNDLMPRTTHPDTDPAEQEEFKKRHCPRPLIWLSKRTMESEC
jgi:transposase